MEHSAELKIAPAERLSNNIASRLLSSWKKGGKRIVCSAGAAIGIFGGIASLAAGVLCVIVHVLLPSDSAFGQVGTVLLITGIEFRCCSAVRY